MGREMTVPNCEPEYTRLPILLRSLGGDHLAVTRIEGILIAQKDAVLRIRDVNPGSWFFSILDPGKEKINWKFPSLDQKGATNFTNKEGVTNFTKWKTFNFFEQV